MAVSVVALGLLGGVIPVVLAIWSGTATGISGIAWASGTLSPILSAASAGSFIAAGRPRLGGVLGAVAAATTIEIGLLSFLALALRSSSVSPSDVANAGFDIVAIGVGSLILGLVIGVPVGALGARLVRAKQRRP